MRRWSSPQRSARDRKSEPGLRGHGGRGLLTVCIIFLAAASGCSQRPQQSPPIDWAEQAKPQDRPLWDSPEPVPVQKSGEKKAFKPPPAAASRSKPRVEEKEPASDASAGHPVSASQASGRSTGGPSSESGAKFSGSAQDGPRGGAGGAGAGDSAEEPAPPPALPGRGPRQPGMSAERAAGFAKARLDLARSALRGGDVENASQLALEAYDAAAPHAAGSPKCGSLCAEAGKFLETIARKQGRAADQPTRFE